MECGGLERGDARHALCKHHFVPSVGTGRDGERLIGTGREPQRGRQGKGREGGTERVSETPA